jgi:hypothetical protein
MTANDFFASTRQVAENYYPVNTAAYIRDDVSQFSVLVDRSQGACEGAARGVARAVARAIVSMRHAPCMMMGVIECTVPWAGRGWRGGCGCGDGRVRRQTPRARTRPRRSGVADGRRP